ncbi:hypothetical protein Tco_0969894 [Tanacetum coccineum]
MDCCWKIDVVFSWASQVTNTDRRLLPVAGLLLLQFLGGSISSDSFLPSILLLVVIVVTVVIVVVILVVVVVAIVGVVIVVVIIGVVVVVTIIRVVIVVVGNGVPSIIKISFVIVGSFSCYWSSACPCVLVSIVSICHVSSLCFQSSNNTISN